MKKCLFLVAVSLMLAGCGSVETFETMADEPMQQVAQVQRDTVLMLPQETAVQTVSSDAGTLYLCDGYEVTLQILPAGDLNGTILTLTGFSWDALTVMTTETQNCTRHETVWCAAGESGDTVGRAVILDDGQYHYCLTVFGTADDASVFADQWQQILSSFSLA